MMKQWRGIFGSLGLLGLVLTGDLRAGGDSVFECVTVMSTDGYSGRLTLTETGRSELIGKMQNAQFKCALQVSGVEYRAQAVIPEIRIQYQLGACQFVGQAALGPEVLKARLNETIRVWIERGKGTAKDSVSEQYRSRVQWVRHLQPMSCRVERLDRESIIRMSQAMQ